MDIRQELLRRLVISGHLNVAERQALGSVSRSEVAEIVKSLLLAIDKFPVRNEGKAVREGATITKRKSEIQITWQRSYPWNPFSVAESRKEAFTNLEAAVERFVETEWKSGIDGINLD